MRGSRPPMHGDGGGWEERRSTLQSADYADCADWAAAGAPGRRQQKRLCNRRCTPMNADGRRGCAPGGQRQRRGYPQITQIQRGMAGNRRCTPMDADGRRGEAHYSPQITQIGPGLTPREGNGNGERRIRRLRRSRRKRVGTADARRWTRMGGEAGGEGPGPREAGVRSVGGMRAQGVGPEHSLRADSSRLRSPDTHGSYCSAFCCLTYCCSMLAYSRTPLPSEAARTRPSTAQGEVPMGNQRILPGYAYHPVFLVWCASL